MLYVIPADPASPPISLRRLRARAKRAGYQIACDRYAQSFSLIDARLRVPLQGLDHVGLGEIARAIEAVRQAST
jgi:hypothetical protein